MAQIKFDHLGDFICLRGNCIIFYVGWHNTLVIGPIRGTSTKCKKCCGRLICLPLTTKFKRCNILLSFQRIQQGLLHFTLIYLFH